LIDLFFAFNVQDNDILFDCLIDRLIHNASVFDLLWSLPTGEQIGSIRLSAKFATALRRVVTLVNC
jgi:hypothetical protein